MWSLGGCCTCAYPLGERMLVEGGEGVDGVLLEPSSLSKRDETFVERLNSRRRGVCDCILVAPRRTGDTEPLPLTMRIVLTLACLAFTMMTLPTAHGQVRSHPVLCRCGAQRGHTSAG